MRLLTDKKPYRIVADEGKHIRSKNDVYREAYIDKEGNFIEENLPHYTKTIYVPDNFDDWDMFELYVEESEE